MNEKWKIVVPVGLVAFALVCIFGGRALVDQVNATNKDDPTAQQSQAAEETPNATPVDGSVYVKGNISTATASPAPAPVASSSPAKETITVDEDGTVIIRPDFEAQANSATNIITPDTQVTANMGGSGGGELPLGQDGAYHGDNPATPAPASTTKPTTKPSNNTPAPVTPPAPESTPAEQPIPSKEPSDGGSSTTPDNGGGAPNRNGTYDGEISPDGKYEWWAGVDEWVDRSSTGGATGGNHYDPNAQLSGNKVGSM